jgi:hypothetical protein
LFAVVEDSKIESDVQEERLGEEMLRTERLGTGKESVWVWECVGRKRKS